MKLNNTFDSEDEYYFACWLEELKNKGLILSYETQIQFDLITKKSISSNKKSRLLCREWTYTTDFKINWSPEVIKENLFVSNCVSKSIQNPFYTTQCTNDIITYVDIKSSYTSKYKVTDITFPLVQKYLLEHQNIYINKIKPLCKKTGLFKTTFTPIAFNLTKTGKMKKQNWNHKTLDEYLNEIRQQ